MSYVTHTVRNPYPVRWTPQRLHVSEGVQGRTPFLGQGRPQHSQGRATKLWAVWVPFTCLLLIATTLQTSCVSLTAAAAFRCASRYTLCAFYGPQKLLQGVGQARPVPAHIHSPRGKSPSPAL